MSAELTPRQVKCLAALLAGESVSDAARLAAVSEKTVTRWKSDAVFRSALRQALDEKMRSSSLRLAVLADLALDTLEDVLNGNAGRDAGIKRLAAVNVLALRLEYYDAVDINERLTALEGQVYEH
jgi:hypothetical protein